MNDSVTRSTMWNEGAKAGVVLGLYTVIFIFLNSLTGKVDNSIASFAVNLVLWVLKFCGCIYLMRFFMKRFAAGQRVTNATTFRLGVIIAVCSALIVAAGALAEILFISPDSVSEQMDLIRSMYGSMLDSNSMQLLDRVESNMPQITFFTDLVYCSIYGTILSAILSRNIPPKDPFAGMDGTTSDGDTSDGQTDEQ